LFASEEPSSLFLKKNPEFILAFKIQWSTDYNEGAFTLRGGLLRLVWTDDNLDRLSRPLAEDENGFTATAIGGEGKLQLVSSGELFFQVKGKTYQKLVVPSGARLEAIVGDEVATLRIQSDEAENDPNLGLEVGGYRLLGLLGAGAVGKVYRAKQLALDRDIALKILKHEAAQNPVAVTSFRREAVAAGRLSHQNLVPVFDVGQSDDLHFYSMELVPGGNLEEKIKEDGPLPWRQAVMATLDCSYALAYAEEHRLIHRDVKPENLMLSLDGTVKLADLGLATTRGMLDQEAAGGTPHFMAPEVAMKLDVDHRADLYSLGCTLFRLVTGETVFEGNAVREILLAHANEEPPTLAECGYKVPKALENLLATLLAKEPQNRPNSAEEVIESLEDILRSRTRRRSKLAFLALLVGASFWYAEASKTEVAPETIVKEVLVQDPAAAEAQAQLETTRIRLKLANAKALPDIPERKEALLGFIQSQPPGPWIEEARLALKEADSLPTGAEPEDNVDPIAASLAQAQREISEHLSAGRFQEALNVPSQHLALPQDVQGQLISFATGLLTHELEKVSQRHSSFLQAGNLAKATELRGKAESAVGTYSENYSALFAQWLKRELDFSSKSQRLEREAGRQALVATLSKSCVPAILKWDFLTAESALTEHLNSIRSGNLRIAMSPYVDFLGEATDAKEALDDKLAKDIEVIFIHPKTKKKTALVRIQEAGFLVEAQRNGVKETEILGFDQINQPAFLASFLSQTLGDTVPPSSLSSLFLLIGSSNLAPPLRSWGEALPSKGVLLQMADEAHAWAAQPSIALTNVKGAHRMECQALFLLETVCRALAENRVWEAQSALRALESHFAWTSVLASNGQSDWGVRE